jgi:Zinc-binding dehydrogenase
MRPPSVFPILEGFAGTCGLEQSIAQPRCIAPLKIEGLAEYPGLMPAPRMRGVQTIVLDLAHIEDCLIGIWQTLRHRGRLASHPVERKPTGGKDKCDYVKNEFGFDECIDHRDPDLAAKLKGACPKGIDVYFENVGGVVFEAAFPYLNTFARVPVCGLVAHYNDDMQVAAPKWAPSLKRAVLTKRLTIRGFIVSDFSARHDDFLRDMTSWVREGRVKYKEFVTEGLENAPTAFIGLLGGANFGKQLVHVDPERA